MRRRVRLVILGEVALPITVNEVVTWEAAQPGPLHVARAEAAIAGRALPLAAADLGRVMGWSKSKAEELLAAVRKGGGNPYTKPFLSL